MSHCVNQCCGQIRIAAPTPSPAPAPAPVPDNFIRYRYLEKITFCDLSNRIKIVTIYKNFFSNQCCEFGMFITHSVPDFIHPGSRISDPGYNNSAKRRGGQQNFLSFNCHKYYKIVNDFIFEQVKNFYIALALRFLYFLPKKDIKSYRFGIRDPESGKTCSGSRIQGQKGI
jgi:hypothetical protein